MPVSLGRAAGDSYRPGSRLCKDDTGIIQAYVALVTGWIAAAAAAASPHRQWNGGRVRRITRCRVNNRPRGVRKLNVVVVVVHLK